MVGVVSHSFIVGIAGGSGSGKSTVARKVAEGLAPTDVAFLEMDAYYHNHAHVSMDERRRINWDHPDCLDLDLLVSHLDALRGGFAIDKPVYDYVSHTRAPQSVRVEPAEVVIVDGVLLLSDGRLRDRLSVRVFVDVDADLRLVRRIRRDMSKRGRPLPEILDQYVHTVRPMHQQFVEPSKRHADIIVPDGGHNTVAIQMVVAHTKHQLSARA